MKEKITDLKTIAAIACPDCRVQEDDRCWKHQ